MTSAKLGSGLGCFLLICCAAVADEPNAILTAPVPLEVVVQKEQQPAQKGDKDKKDDKTAPPQIDFSEAPPLTAEATRGPRPNMIGDILSPIYSRILVPIPSLAKLELPELEGQTLDVPFTGRRLVSALVSGRGPYKIGENESPLPQDRIYFSYNYFNNAQAPANGSNLPLNLTQFVPFNNGVPRMPNNGPRGGATLAEPLASQSDLVLAHIFIPGVAPPRLDVSRQTLGFEKTFLDGNASLGVRIPFYEQNGAQQFSSSGIGDVTFIAKYAPYISQRTGSGISYGLAVTAPTGPSIPTPTGSIHSTILQPFTGYQLSGERLLLYGFLSVALPTESQDVSLLFNDIGIGYRMFNRPDGLVRTVMPALEAHVTTPLNHRDADAVIRGIDQVILTGGLHFGLGEQSLLTLGVATPVTGPRIFDVEAVVQFNLRF